MLVTAPCELTHALLPGMIERRFGRIVNVASVAGLIPGTPGHTLYAAAKAFMVKFSESLLLENKPHNVLTTALCPGFTHTEFHDVTGVRKRVLKFGKAWWSTAEEVAEAGYDGVMRGRSIVITGRRSKQIALLMKLLPEPLALRMVAGRSQSFRRGIASKSNVNSLGSHRHPRALRFVALSGKAASPRRRHADA